MSPGGWLEVAVEEVGGGMKGLEPAAVGEEGVDLVGHNELLDRDASLAEVLDKADGLAEGDVAVVVAVDHEDGSAPVLHRGDGRGLEGEPRPVVLDARIVVRV